MIFKIMVPRELPKLSIKSWSKIKKIKTYSTSFLCKTNEVRQH